jgi:hypothetical protein
MSTPYITCSTNDGSLGRPILDMYQIGAKISFISRRGVGLWLELTPFDEAAEGA